MDREEKIKRKNIIKNYRNDDLLDKIIEEFCFRFKGQITREEVERILKANGFDGVYVLSDKDYLSVNEGEGKEIDSAGVYLADLKCIALREKFLKYNVAIGCHELTHALIDGKLFYLVECCEWEASYGLGLEEGVATAVERMPGRVNITSEDNLHFGYGKNYRIIRELNLLYKRSKYKRYGSIIVEAIKHPDMFFNLIYRIVFENIKGIYAKAKDKDEYNDISIEDLKMISLKCSFVILQSSDMLVEFKGKDVSEFENSATSTAYGLTRFLNGCLLSHLDRNIREGIISPEYIGPFVEKDLNLFQVSEEERLLMAIFGSEATYYQRLVHYIDRILVEYTLEIERLRDGEDSLFVYKKEL